MLCVDDKMGCKDRAETLLVDGIAFPHSPGHRPEPLIVVLTLRDPERHPSTARRARARRHCLRPLLLHLLDRPEALRAGTRSET